LLIRTAWDECSVQISEIFRLAKNEYLYWQVSEASETLSEVYHFEICDAYMHIYIYIYIFIYLFM